MRYSLPFLFAVLLLICSPQLKAQVYTWADGYSVDYTDQTTLTKSSGDNGSTPSGEGGQAGGVVNLMTSGYNAVYIIGGGGSGDHGWVAIIPLTAAERATTTKLYNNTTGGTAGFSVSSTQTTVSSYYKAEYQITTTPTSPWTEISSATNATVIWDGTELHFVSGGSLGSQTGSTDSIVPVPSGWTGYVAIINMVEQSSNTSDGYADAIYSMSAAISPPPPPTGTISVNSAEVRTGSAVTITWSIN